MSSTSVLVDAGPLIALADASDAAHADCVELARSIPGPGVTVWPAVVEALHILRFSSRAQDQVLGWLQEEAFVVAPFGSPEIPRVRELMRKYQDLPMDFADAALVAVAEREGISMVFTLDSDFHLYRPRHVRSFKLLPSR